MTKIIKRVLCGSCFFCVLQVGFLTLRPSFAFSIPEPIPGENQSIGVFGSTVKIKGLTDQANKVFANGREISIQKDGSFYEEIIVPVGQTEVVLEAVDPRGVRNRYSKNILAKENHLFLAGIVDGTVNFVNATQGFDLQRDNKSFKSGTHFSGKASYYLAGKVKGKYLIKSTLDTDKATQEKLFTNIDPDKYYPIYGDNSTVVYDSNSQGKFYLLVTWDKSGITAGNYQTQIGGEDSKLSAYNRTLYGGKVHLETPERTVYGGSRSQFTGFIAEANQLSGHSEFQATGGSLYYLRHRNIVEGSEQVRIEVRDKRSGIVVSSVSQAENADYEIKYDEGRILFRKPVLSAASSDTVITDGIQEGNEVFLVVNYEYKPQDAFPILPNDIGAGTGGFRVSHHLGDHLRIGGTYVQEEKDLTNHTLHGADATLRLGNFTKVSYEYAQTRADSTKSYVSYNGGYDFTELAVDNRQKGLARRAEFHSALGEYLGRGREFLDLSGWWQFLDRNFSPSDSLFESGTLKYGAEADHRFSENDNIRLLYENKALVKEDGLNRAAQNEAGATRVEDMTAQWLHKVRRFSFTTEHRARHKKNSLSAVKDPALRGSKTENILAEKVDYELFKETSVFVGQQVGLDDSADDVTSAGVTHRVSDDVSIFLRGAVGQDRNSVLAGLEKEEDPRTSRYAHYSVGNTAVDGKTSTTSFGSNTKISDTAELRREKQFVVSDRRGSYTTNLMGLKNQITPRLDLDATYDRREEALDDRLKGSTPRETTSATLSYNRPDHLKFSSKYEYRVDTGDQWQQLSDSQGELKLTQDWFLFGEYEYSRDKDIARGISISRIDKKEAGVAFRPVDFDWLNFLFKYIRLQDDRPRDITSADGGSLKQKSTYDEYAGEVAVDLPRHFQWVEKVAYKDEHLIAVDVNNVIETPQNLEAYLLVHRLNYHVTNRWDVAAEFRALRQQGSDANTLEYGPLFEFVYHIHKYFGIGAGYNFTPFKDDLTVLDKKKAEGVFLRVQGKY